MGWGKPGICAGEQEIEAAPVSWFLYALLASLLLTLINFGDKFVVSHRIADARAVLVYYALINLAIGGVLWLVMGLPVLPLRQAIGLILAGTPIIWGNFFYLTALKQEEASRVIVLNQLTPLLILVGSVVLLGAQFAGWQIVGFFIILIAAIGISVRPVRGAATRSVGGAAVVGDGQAALHGEVTRWYSLARLRRMRLSPALMLAVLAGLFWSSSALIIDVAVSDYVRDFGTLTISVAYASIGYALGGGLMYLLVPSVRRQFAQVQQRLAWRDLLPMLLIEGTFVVRQFVFYQAVLLSEIALVAIVGSTQPLFGLILGAGLTLLVPRFYGEDISRAALVQKAVWVALMVVGLLMISV